MRSALLALTATAPILLAAMPALAAKDNCVFLRTIDGFNVIDDETLIVYTGPRSAYRVNLFGHCPEVRYTETIAIDSRDGRLCWPSNNHILTGHGGRCLVDSVVKLTPDDLAKLKASKGKPEAH